MSRERDHQNQETLELGGDYTRDLTSRLKSETVLLETVKGEDYLTLFDAPGDVERFREQHTQTETVGRENLTWTAARRLVIEGGAEFAYNDQLSHTRYVVNAEPQVVPGADVFVREDLVAHQGRPVPPAAGGGGQPARLRRLRRGLLPVHRAGAGGQRQPGAAAGQSGRARLRAALLGLGRRDADLPTLAADRRDRPCADLQPRRPLRRSRQHRRRAQGGADPGRDAAARPAGP